MLGSLSQRLELRLATRCGIYLIHSMKECLLYSMIRENDFHHRGEALVILLLGWTQIFRVRPENITRPEPGFLCLIGKRANAFLWVGERPDKALDRKSTRLNSS